MRVLIGILFLVVGFFQTALAQQGQGDINRRAETYMMGEISDQLIRQLSDLPNNIRRAAIYKINYDDSRFSNESIAYIKGEIENTIRENTPISVISPPELDPTDKLKIVGSDSTLQLMNIKGRSLADMSPELLERVANKYSLSGLIELTVQQKRTEGLVVLIRIMSPQSREIVWAESIAAFPVEEQEEEDTGKRVVFRFGATLMENESFSTPISPDSEIQVGTTSLNYNVSLGYRQPYADDNSGYLGFYTGLNVVRSNESQDFETTFWEIGMSVDQAISRKTESINDYRLMLGVDASIWIAQNERSGNLITVNPALMFNMTKNIGFEVYGLYFITDRSVTGEAASTNSYTYGQIGYGVRAYVQF